MFQKNKYNMIWIVAVAALSAVSSPLLAYDVPDIGLTDSSSFNELTSKYDEWAMSASHYALNMLGIDNIDYIGAFTYSENGPIWQFKTEPEIMEVDHEGPLHRRIKNGDAVVAIDGNLITTERAGVQFANLDAGKPVELTFRRNGEMRTITVIPRHVLKPIIPIELTVSCTEQSRKENSITVVPGRTILPEYAPMINKIRKRYWELRSISDSLGWTESPEYRDRAPRGWIGFGLTFSGGVRRNDEGKPADWFFFELPSIKSIQPGSPADEAGLEVGDTLVEIDGKKLDSPKGGDKFSHMEPGQTIKWTIKRGNDTLKIETTAEERP